LDGRWKARFFGLREGYMIGKDRIYGTPSHLAAEEKKKERRTRKEERKN